MNKMKTMWKHLFILLLFFGSVHFAQAQNNFTSLQKRINSTANNGTLTLDRDYVATSSENRLNIGKNITIDLNGHVINRNLSTSKDNGGVFYVNSNITLTIKDSRPTASHSPAVAYTDPVTHESITINGGIVMGGNTTGNGGGIMVCPRGTLKLNGGTVAKNKAMECGGGVYNGDKTSTGTTVFTMTGGNIVGNVSTHHGGGIYNEKNGRLVMRNSEISGNEANNQNTTQVHGGGIYNEGYLEITSCSISNNSALFANTGTWGGGIYHRGATLLVTDSEIVNNRAYYVGGGIACDVPLASPSIKIVGTKVSNNKVTVTGGGLYFLLGSATNLTFHLKDCTIEGNEAGPYGGGVFIDGGKNWTYDVSVNKIKNNKARNGGGLYLNNTILEMHNDSILDNKAEYCGGGVCLAGYNVVFTMKDRLTIRGNTAKNGGGLYAGETSYTVNTIFAMKGGEISNNIANNSGGGVYNRGVFTFTGGKISGNTAVTANWIGGGGGVYNEGDFSMSNGEISTNSTRLNGGGVHNHNGTFNLNGGKITGNTANVAGNGIYQYGVFNLSGSPTFDANDVYLCSESTAERRGNNHVITKAGDITCPQGSIHVILGNSNANLFVGRNILETGSATVASNDLKLFTFDNKANYNGKFLFERYFANDPLTTKPVIELFSNAWPAYVTSEPAGFALNNIDSPEDLAWLISVVNGYNNQPGNPNAKAYLKADVDMSAHEWVPIGHGNKPFTGNFNGEGHIISNLRNTTEGYEVLFNPGMFGHVDKGIVRNTFVKNCNFVTPPGKEGYYGIIVDTIRGSTTQYSVVAYSEAQGLLKASDNASHLGGIIGFVDEFGGLHSSISIADLEGYEMGGLVCKTRSTIACCLSHPKFTYKGSGGDKIGGLVAENINSMVHESYLRKDRGNSLGSATYNPLVAQGTSARNCYHPATYTVTQRLNDKYMYDHKDQLVDGTHRLLDTLNIGTSGYAKWTRTMASPINDDYPILALPDLNCMAQVDNTNDIFMEYSANINILIDKYNNTATGGNILLYQADTMHVIKENNNANVAVFIAENVGVRQTVENQLKATVGITFDNSNGTTAMGGKPYDWHMFSTPLQQAAMGIDYSNLGTTIYPYLMIPAQTTFTPESYFPTNTPYASFDFYCYSEPYYHWINFKRNSISHWHEDEPHDNIPYTNETVMPRGKGYMMGIDKQTMLMNKGMLTTGDFDYPLSYTELVGPPQPLRGCNLIGNPYQSYIDFDALANADIDTYYVMDADKGGYIAYTKDATPSANTAPRYIHPHQGFIVQATAAGQRVTFTNAMRYAKGKKDSHFRDGEDVRYPLVNLACIDAEGARDYATLELERPASGGGEKVDGLRAGDAAISIHLDDKDYQIAFAPTGLLSVPVHFKAYAEGNFTLSWSTENGTFSYLHLIDNITGVDVDCLQTEEYKFTASTNDYKSRFRLEFKFTGVDELDAEVSDNFAFQFGDEIVINGKGRVEMFDLSGRLIMAENVIGPQSSINKPNSASGLYLIRLTSDSKTSVQKMIFK